MTYTGSEMRCYVSKKTLAQACCLSVILIFILTFVPFSLTNPKEKAAFDKQTKGKLLVVQSAGTKLLARPKPLLKVEEVKVRPPVEIKSPEQVKVMTPVDNKNPAQVNVRPPVENKAVDIKPPVENKQADFKPPVENKQVDVKPAVENKQVDVRPPVENKVPQQVDVRPPVENKVPQHVDVRPSVENKVPQQVDVRPPGENKITQQADVVRSPTENKNPAPVKEKPAVGEDSPDTQRKRVDIEKHPAVASLGKPYPEPEKSSIAKTGAELNEKLDTEKKNILTPQKGPDEVKGPDTIETVSNKEGNRANAFNKDSEKPVAAAEKNEKRLVPVENNYKTADSTKTEVTINSSTAEKDNLLSITKSNKTDINRKLIDLNVKNKHPVSVIKVQNKVLPVTIPGPKDLQHMERDQLEELYYLYIENLQTHCVRQRHIGNEEYGGYHICEDVMNDLPCLVYSFGCKPRNDVSFDYEVARQYGCDVHLFNPLNKVQGTQTTSNKMTFHTIGLTGEDDPEHNALTLSSIKAKLNHKEKKIDILKLDLESGEWGALEQMCKGHDLDNVKLIIVEFHVCTKNCLDNNQRTKEHYVRYLSLLKELYDLGFRIYFFRMWPACTFKVNGNTHTACHDVHMVKKS